MAAPSGRRRLRTIGVTLLRLYAAGWLLYAAVVGVAIAAVGDARAYIPWFGPVLVALPGLAALLLARLACRHAVVAGIVLTALGLASELALVLGGRTGDRAAAALFVLYPAFVGALLLAAGRRGRAAG